MHAADEEKYIIAADDLAPSETIQLERERVLAFVTRQGSTILIQPFLPER